MACKRRQNRSVMRLRLMLRKSTTKRSHIRKLLPPKSRLPRSRPRARRRQELQRRSPSSSMLRIRRSRPPRRSLRDRSKTPREMLVTPSRRRPERRRRGELQRRRPRQQSRPQRRHGADRRPKLKS